MLDYKKVIKNTIDLLKENKLIILFTVLISLSGFIFFSGVLSNYDYFLNHRYFISLSTSFTEILKALQSFIYNSIIANAGESITNLFNLARSYSSNTELINGTIIFEIITFIVVVFMFFLSNILSTFIVYSSKKQSLPTLFKETKGVLKNVFLLDLLRILSILVVFGIITLISRVFYFNSYLFIIISYFFSGLLFFVLFFISQYALRYIIFFKNGVVSSINNSIKLFTNNIKESITNVLLLFIQLILLFVLIILISLPIILLNFYLVSSDYGIFDNINTIFINIIIIILTSFANIYIIKYINELFGKFVLKNKK